MNTSIPNNDIPRLLRNLIRIGTVDRWDESWPESTKRAVVRAAYFVHRHKGTVTELLVWRHKAMQRSGATDSE